MSKAHLSNQKGDKRMVTLCVVLGKAWEPTADVIKGGFPEVPVKAFVFQSVGQSLTSELWSFLVSGQFNNMLSTNRLLFFSFL